MFEKCSKEFTKVYCIGVYIEISKFRTAKSIDGDIIHVQIIASERKQNISGGFKWVKVGEKVLLDSEERLILIWMAKAFTLRLIRCTGYKYQAHFSGLFIC